MNDNATQIKKLIIGAAEVYGEAMTKTRLELYYELLSELSPRTLELALKTIMRNGAQTRFPLPGVILQAACPSRSPEAEAVEAAGRIPEALYRYGYTDPHGAKDFIGELGWLIVEREGGWECLCAKVTTNQLPILKAQWREMAKSLYSRAKAGLNNIPPSLPHPTRRITIAELPSNESEEHLG